MDPEPPAAQLLLELLQQAVQAHASDIHLHRRQNDASVGFRLDGVLTLVRTIPAEPADRLFGRIKFLARLKTYQESLPQDGRIDRADTGTDGDIRVATYPTITGEKIVLRLFQTGAPPKLKQLGFPAPAVAELEQFLAQPSGLLLLTGPAGSGKTTTIYACLQHLSAGGGGRHVITVEDPVERVIDGIMQTEIHEGRGLTYAVAARHLLRQDPQVLVIGEIRDEETASVAVRAALTGHQLISTLHAGSCRGVIERLLGLCREPHAVLTAIELVLNQRLIRRLCPDCAGKGCDACLKSGYRGRTPVVEWLRLNDPLRRQIRETGTDGIAPARSLRESVRDVLAAGRSDQKEAARVLGQWPPGDDDATTTNGHE
jgi:type II secretory ATPase GspE/PulE/Tfp pilus assembly ATPase PilB-like protein